MANQIQDGISSSATTDQSETPDDVAVTTHPSETTSAPAVVDDSENPDVIETISPEDMINENGAIITPEEMNLAQLKVRVVCQEKANMALRMELKCAELQVT